MKLRSVRNPLRKLLPRVERSGSRSLPNIFIPQIWMRGYEFAHHSYAGSVVENSDVYAVLAEQIFRTFEVAVFSDEDAGNAK